MHSQLHARLILADCLPKILKFFTALLLRVVDDQSRILNDEARLRLDKRQIILKCLLLFILYFMPHLMIARF